MLDIVYQLATYIHGHVFCGLDIYGKIYIYIDELEALKEKRFYIDLTGRGVSLEDAATAYITLLLNKEYVFRCVHQNGYYTQRIRHFVTENLQIKLLEVDDYV